MTVVLSPRAEKQLRKVPKVAQIAVARKIRSLRDFSVVSGEEKLAGYPSIFRMKVGDYRIVYRKITQELYIILIHHRRATRAGTNVGRLVTSIRTGFHPTRTIAAPSLRFPSANRRIAKT